MEVLYNNIAISNNQKLSLSETLVRPQVVLPTDIDMSTLIMYDPDAVGNKTFIHWLQTDGKDLLPYLPPSPPPNSGTHRYIFEIYGKTITTSQPGIERSVTSIDQTKQLLGLYGPPLYKTQFVSENTSGQGGRKTNKRKRTIRRRKQVKCYKKSKSNRRR